MRMQWVVVGAGVVVGSSSSGPVKAAGGAAAGEMGMGP
jgi:hypothetical protein